MFRELVEAVEASVTAVEVAAEVAAVDGTDREDEADFVEGAEVVTRLVEKFLVTAFLRFLVCQIYDSTILIDFPSSRIKHAHILIHT